MVAGLADTRWVRDFMDCQGQVVVANYLANMSKKGIKGASDAELEFEILKFFKKALSNRVGRIPVELS